MSEKTACQLIAEMIKDEEKAVDENWNLIKKIIPTPAGAEVCCLELLEKIRKDESSHLNALRMINAVYCRESGK